MKLLRVPEFKRGTCPNCYEARYNAETNTVFLPAHGLEDSDAFTTLHEIGHAQDPEIERIVTSGVHPTMALRLPREAFAWRWVVKLVKRHRPLREDEKANIRNAMKEYVAAVAEERKGKWAHRCAKPEVKVARTLKELVRMLLGRVQESSASHANGISHSRN